MGRGTWGAPGSAPATHRPINSALSSDQLMRAAPREFNFPPTLPSAWWGRNRIHGAVLFAPRGGGTSYVRGARRVLSSHSGILSWMRRVETENTAVHSVGAPSTTTVHQPVGASIPLQVYLLGAPILSHCTQQTNQTTPGHSAGTRSQCTS